MVLSIIVPVYNVGKYLRRCVDSIINQMTNECELILIDDGSTDNSPGICDEYSHNYDNIYVAHQSNGGLSRARNHGIDIAKGEYLLFIDSDDWIEEGTLEKFLEIIKMYSPDVINAKAQVVNSFGEKKEKIRYSVAEGIYDRKDYLKQLEKGKQFTPCAPFYLCKTKIIIENGLRFKEGILNEDDLWTPMLLLNANKIYFLDFVFYNHFMRDDSIMHSTNYNEKGKSYLEVCQELSLLYENKDEIIILRDVLACIFLQAFCMVDNHMDCVNIYGKKIVVSNAYYMKTRLKALLFYISPRLYLFIHKCIKKY